MSTASLNIDPYWWQAGPLQSLEEAALPARCDVAVVGSGLTGLSAALTLARGGREVLVLEAGELGQGASTRNAGYVGRSSKHRFSDLLATVGTEQAIAIYRELRAAFDAVVEVIRDEAIECGFAVRGRFIPAPSPAHYEDLAHEFEAQAKHLGIDFAMVPRSEQHRELGTDRYHGGVVVPDLAGLHPGLYHAGLLRSARAAGVRLAAGTPVKAVHPDADGVRLETARGAVLARHAIVATNGYTGTATPWLQRRLVPFDAYMIATEPVPAAVMDKVLPTRRTCIDWNTDALYIRPSPDLTRILFGALTGTRPGDLRVKAARLEGILKSTFPDLKEVGLQHVWTGRCAATFDMFPHLTRAGALTYVGGYCFAGVPMGTYLGRKAAKAILGSTEADTVFARREFPTMPLYRPNAFLAPAAMVYYRWRDRRAARAARA